MHAGGITTTGRGQSLTRLLLPLSRRLPSHESGYWDFAHDTNMLDEGDFLERDRFAPIVVWSLRNAAES
jgi:hypothetical protein